MEVSSKKVLILGSGPIVIGQACEFDYSGTQACKALIERGFEVILLNSNPATIMTDVETATKVYIEPLTVPFVEKILQKEKPQFLIPTLGGQVALNLALELEDAGVLKKYKVQLMGANAKTIRKAENREEFRDLLSTIGAKYPESILVHSFEEGVSGIKDMEFPLILRPNYTLGGSGGGVVHSMEEFEKLLPIGLRESPSSEVLVESSLLGWKEFELEVMRDKEGVFVVVCSIENFDPCGVHTGDSIAVSPQQTLSDFEYQEMRSEAKKIIEVVGVETGGANIQFAVHPETGARLVIEMNPRVSRSSALASKATGFPIAKIAALLAMGYKMEDIPNDITKSTPSCYEPALDYIVTKTPWFDFEKFEGSTDSLTTQMKSVGEAMGIGRTFIESFIKSLWSIEKNRHLLRSIPFSETKLSYPNSQRVFYLFQAFREGWSVKKVNEVTSITPYFLDAIYNFIQIEFELKQAPELTKELLLKLKKQGFPDELIAHITGQSQSDVRKQRWKQNILPAYYCVDTCAAEFKSQTPYFYSTYMGLRDDSYPTQKNGVVILGSGPNRIGQGIEFDYSAVRAVKKFKQYRCRTIMINSNPETVSTDYDTADELFFEPLSEEHVLEVLRYIQPHGVCPQFGGQTAIELSESCAEAGHKILGSSLKTIELAEDRMKFAKLCLSSGLNVPEARTAGHIEEALSAAEQIGFPLMCRPSFVLGGRRMRLIQNKEELQNYFSKYQTFISKENPCLLDQFLDGYLEVDVDMVRGVNGCVIGGLLEHIEATGVHSGDSMGVIPPQRLKLSMISEIEECAKRLADRLQVIGLLNLQIAIKDDQIYIIEANPRSSRSMPFIAKATKIPIIDLAVKAILESTPSLLKLPPVGQAVEKSSNEEFPRWDQMTSVCVKSVVFPFKKFNDTDSILGPEMKSIGEVMGRGREYPEALFKALISSNFTFPSSGEVFLSLKEKDKSLLLDEVKELVRRGYTLSGTGGTARYFQSKGVDCLSVKKVHEGRPHCVDRIRSGKVVFVFNTTSGNRSIQASFGIRRSCVDHSIPCLTDKDAVKSFIIALKKCKEINIPVSAISE